MSPVITVYGCRCGGETINQSNAYHSTGVISSTLVSIDSSLSRRALTILDKSLITSSTSLFALLISPISGLLADGLGRKKVILLADALFVLGALWQALSTTVWGMILGRSVIGLAVGSASFVTPLYISEIAPAQWRGRLVTVSSLFITGGQVVAYLIGWAFSQVNGGWRWMVGLGAVPAILQLLALLFMPGGCISISPLCGEHPFGQSIAEYEINIDIFLARAMFKNARNSSISISFWECPG